ncbi:nitrous oxide reductase family maturation protein NosD [Schinkia azotoformans]|uniref:nitrous oxide reductase family maturation protein NosD n=1 Tax=Schinkia azotoformans TaxID=1454 RepID=UPI002DBAAE1C|nr:nitrous oxide reductase family maturation protein NosD [Schinkia azotoformans]MEC1718176.1 nitrous oxide reductase family maturation protein NosD [Schinkia azotoformans]MEC1740120.1 nitrous oxide reductase family maturation protein NosD [Schinkia azotoformans]MEC1744662.1 nitrous oxide reductase family maturation protein NosD [Schinkia azotoformans]MEC1758309.1 nitrous oxide reductase family maturation protein NosD [Schinkia azotoformans]MEC1768224.1 nitrous oxide reductase family maturatio
MGKKTGLISVFFSILILCFMHGQSYAAELEVGKDKMYETISSAIEQAGNGDIIKVYPGNYKEKLEITKSLTLESIEKEKAIIEGDKQKHVITIKSPNVVINGFKIKGSGENFLDNDAGILIDQNNDAKIINNVFEDVLFGIYIDSSEGNLIKDNEIYGFKDKKFSERGNGFHFFNSKNNTIDGNIISDVRDGMYFDHSDKTVVTNNKISGIRYGLHYMWSNDNSFKNNYFSNNVSGAAIMFSKKINLEQNIFENNRGYRAFGMFFQTVEDSVVENNLFFNNSIGINSDLSRGNVFRKNTIIQNDIGMEVLGSNWDDVIYENSFIDNLQQVLVNEVKINDQWYYGNRGNYWSDYSGIDIEKDGTGDTEHHSGSAFDFFMYKYPHFRLFVESPTAKMLQTVDKMFPVIERAEVVDPFPLLEDLNSEAFLADIETETSKKAGMITFLVSLVVVLLSIRLLVRLSTRFGR